MDFPGLAVCRHPHQILNLEDPKTNQSLGETYNLTLAHLKYLEPYRVNPQNGLEPLFKQFLFNDSSCIRGVTVASRGIYSRASQTNLASKPSTRPFEWNSFFHPIYGACFEFQPEKPPSEYVGTAGIDYMKINVDFDSAFPDLKGRAEQNEKMMSMDEVQKSIMNSVGAGSVLIMIYDKGSFLTTHEIALLTSEANEVFSLQQEVVDKSSTKDLFGCHEYDQEATEDDCLYDCLAKLFVQEFGCLHARLGLMPIRNQTLKATRTCLLDDLELKTKNYSQTINHGQNKPRSAEEFGLIRIRELLAEFCQEDLKARCNCKLKCKRKILSMAKWPSQKVEKARNSTGSRENHKFAVFQVPTL